MKNISQHLGEIIIALAAVALLVCAVVVFKGPMSGFFSNIVEKETGIAENVLMEMQNIGSFAPGEGSGGSGGSGGAGGSGGSGSGGSSLPAVGTSAEDCTWEQIKAISDAGKADEYFNLGDTKTVTLTTGEEVVMEIVAFDADEKASGGTAGITWLSKDLLSTKHIMTSTGTNAGGWEASSMRRWLNTSVYDTLPSEVKSAIVEVTKTYGDYNGGSYTTKTCADKIWIPSLYEIFGTDDGFGCEDSGVSYTSYFTDNASRVKNYSGSATTWWLRSAFSSNSYDFRLVFSGGDGLYTSAGNSYGVALGFCM